MTSYVVGTTATLTAEFREFDNGPVFDVSELTVRVVPVDGGAAVLSATSIGITHPATGVYAFAWAIPENVSGGQYAVAWEGLDGDDQPLGVSEVVELVAVSWPPTLALLKVDRGLTDDRDDAKLTLDLGTAVSYVERVRRPDFNWTEDPLSELPAPTFDLVMGTVRLAYRLHQRRNSPDGMINMGDLGVGRVASFDPDIERMLGVGRFARGRFA